MVFAKIKVHFLSLSLVTEYKGNKNTLREMLLRLHPRTGALSDGYLSPKRAS